MGRKLALLVLGCVLALVLSEGLLRGLGYAGDLERERRVFDRRYGTVQRDSWIWDFEIDPARHHAVDLRGQRIPLAKPPGETRVLFVGDSATEGAFVGLARSFPRRFEALLAEREPQSRVRAINAGVWGMTTIDEYHLLKDKLLPLQPDVVVIGLFMANDLNFNLGHRERRARADGAFDFLRTRSALVHFLSLRWLALAASRAIGAADEPQGWQPLELRVRDPRGLYLLSYPEGELATYLVPASEPIDHAYAVLAQVLGSFRALGREHGFSVRVLLIPSPSRVLARLAILHHPRLLGDLARRGVVIDPAAIDVDAPTRRVLAVCAKVGIACVDPTRRLQRLGPRAFFPTDEHPSAEGHEALAQELITP